MAAHLWLAVLALQAAIAMGVVLAVYGIAPQTSLWFAVPIAVGTFVLLQYLLVALTVLLPRETAAGERTNRSLPQAIRAALTEPLFFGLAQLSMIGAHAAQPPAGCQSRRDAASRTPLLLVHGLACNRGVWRWLISRLRAEGFECIHTLSLEPLRADIDKLADILAREILKIYNTHEGRRVTIVAHSMGGLIVRAALRALDPAVIRRLVTIGTPHHGAGLARALKWTCTGQMCTDSNWLKSLNTLQEDRLPVPVTSIWSLDDNFVRPATSPRLAGAKLKELRGLGHFGLLISASGVDSIVRAVKDIP